MDKRNDGGPAFPVANNGPSGHGGTVKLHPQAGMSLRMWLAGMAMQGLLGVSILNIKNPSETAQVCFDMADAMIKQEAR